MSNPTISVVLDSLEKGTIPSVTGSIRVKEGESVYVNVTWPPEATNHIICDLNFRNSGNQDPFNDVEGGDSSFPMRRLSPNQTAEYILLVQSDADITTDTYDLILTIDGITYTNDPTIIVDGL